MHGLQNLLNRVQGERDEKRVAVKIRLAALTKLLTAICRNMELVKFDFGGVYGADWTWANGRFGLSAHPDGDRLTEPTEHTINTILFLMIQNKKGVFAFFNTLESTCASMLTDAYVKQTQGF